MKALHLFALSLLMLAMACKKDSNDAEPDVQTMPEDKEMKMITASPWIIYKVEVNGLNVWDLFIEACQKDDTYRFYKDSTLMKYENSNVCSGEADSTQSMWSFYNGRKQLLGTVIGISDTADIISLRESDMKLNVNYEGNPALIYFKKP